MKKNNKVEKLIIYVFTICYFIYNSIMALYFICSEQNCPRKFTSKEKLLTHLSIKHNKVSDTEIVGTDLRKEQGPKKFYLCDELNCNKKFKLKEKLVTHTLESHNKILENIPEPVSITKDNKKAEEKKKNENKRMELLEQKRKEIERMKELELQAKKEAEDKYKQEQIERYRNIEEERIKQEQQKLHQVKEINKIDEQWIELISNVQKKCKEEPALCAICSVVEADTAVVPCGHKFFCNECIDLYIKKYPKKGCPICRADITTIIKIFSA